MHQPSLASLPGANEPKGKWKAFLKPSREGSNNESKEPQPPAAAKCREIDELSEPPEGSCFADTLGQPSNTEAELLASGHIEIKGKQFLAQTTRVKVSEWRRGSFLV